MAAQRKPATLHERSGAYRHDPKRRRRDVKGRGELPGLPPAWLQLNAIQTALYTQIAAIIPEGVATGSDVIVVGLAARALAKIQHGKYRSADMAQLRALLNSLALGPAARAALGAPGGGQEENPFDEFGKPPRASKPN